MSEKFETWALVEVMGHRRFAGFVTEQAVGGASFVRIDVPEADEQPPFTKLFGAGSIYCISPISEAVARAMAKQFRSRPIEVYDLPADYQPRIASEAAHEATGCDFDEDERPF